MAKFIEFEANWIVDVIPNPQDNNTSIIYLAAKIDDREFMEVVKGKYEDIKVKLLAL